MCFLCFVEPCCFLVGMVVLVVVVAVVGSLVAFVVVVDPKHEIHLGDHQGITRGITGVSLVALMAGITEGITGGSLVAWRAGITGGSLGESLGNHW